MKEKLVNTADAPEPTKSELEILQVLWKYGPATVRFVNDKMNEQREVQYTSTLKLMQIMYDKGILSRDDSAMKHVYSAAVREESTKSQLLEKFVSSIYHGSASGLMMQLLGNRNASQAELDAIRQLVEEIERKQTL